MANIRGAGDNSDDLKQAEQKLDQVEIAEKIILK